MEKRDNSVGSTADGLVVLRAGKQARSLGLEDPFAHWFVTEDGHRLAEAAQAIDPSYELFNLARFEYTTARLRDLAATYEQVVLVGAGFDCRALWLNEFQAGHARIFEIDTPEKIDQKLQIIKSHDFAIPTWNVHVRADLRTDDVFRLLLATGFNPEISSLVLAEGLTYFVPTKISLRTIDHRWLRLATGSRLILDCWSRIRVKQLNQRTKERLGIELFSKFPFPVSPDSLTQFLIDLGYIEVHIKSLVDIASECWGRPLHDDLGPSSYMVEALL